MKLKFSAYEYSLNEKNILYALDLLKVQNDYTLDINISTVNF